MSVKCVSKYTKKSVFSFFNKQKTRIEAKVCTQKDFAEDHSRYINYPRDV